MADALNWCLEGVRFSQGRQAGHKGYCVLGLALFISHRLGRLQPCCSDPGLAGGWEPVQKERGGSGQVEVDSFGRCAPSSLLYLN